MARHCRTVSLRIWFSRPDRNSCSGAATKRQGACPRRALAELDLPRDADAYVCGPVGFMAEVSAALADLGHRKARIHTEIFGAAPAQTPGIAATATVAPHLPAGEPGAGPSVAFARSGVTAAWDPRYANVLELAEACDVPVRWSCRTGVCHSCETAVLSGGVRYDPDPVEEPADGSTLICCSQPIEDLVLDL